MAVIVLKSALWNKYYLIKEQDKYLANDIKPGLTGCAWWKSNPKKVALNEGCLDNMSFFFNLERFKGAIIRDFTEYSFFKGVFETSKRKWWLKEF